MHPHPLHGAFLLSAEVIQRDFADLSRQFLHVHGAGIIDGELPCQVPQLSPLMV
jgi:hypothetical protein